jgi:uncharacterized protein (DUF58 family)
MFKRRLFIRVRPLTAVRGWFRRRFTPAGLLVLLAVVFSAGFGIDMNLTVAYQAFALLLCVLLVSLAWGWTSRKEFTARRVLPRFGTVGTPLPYRVAVQSATGRMEGDLSLWERMADTPEALAKYEGLPELERPRGRGVVAEAPELKLPALPPGEEVEASHTLMPRQRGVLHFTGMTMVWPDPLGLFRSMTEIRSPQSVLILPRRYPVPRFDLPGRMKYQRGGVALASSVGESEEFVAMRDYRPGDPLRHIHWKGWAKTGRPIVKEFQDEFFVRHALVLDTFTDDGESEAFEEAVSVAASFACTIPDQDSLLDLMFVGPQAVCFTAGRGLAYPEQLLEILASVRPSRDKELSALEQLVLRHAGSVSGCICVLLAWDERRQRFIRQLKSLGIPLMVLVVTPRGDGRELEPGPMADAPENLHRLEVGRAAERLAVL